MPESNIIFGKRIVFEALENDVQIDKVYIDRDNQFMENIKRKVHEKSIQISFVPIEKLNRLTKGNHQGIVATISPIKTLDLNSLEKSIIDNNFNFLILDSVTDTKNFGAIVRTAECLGMNGIIISKSGSSPINGETIKSSSGAIFNIPIFKVDHIKDAIFLLKANGENSIYDHKFERKTSIVMGSEGKGISKSILSLSDNIIMIPMKGKVESLNVSVATGIFISELAKEL